MLFSFTNKTTPGIINSFHCFPCFYIVYFFYAFLFLFFLLMFGFFVWVFYMCAFSSWFCHFILFFCRSVLLNFPIINASSMPHNFRSFFFIIIRILLNFKILWINKETLIYYPPPYISKILGIKPSFPPKLKHVHVNTAFSKSIFPILNLVKLRYQLPPSLTASVEFQKL